LRYGPRIDDMEGMGAGPLTLHFGEFELDLRAGELRGRGRKVLLGEQPLRILEMLIRRPGEVITREEIQGRLWPNGQIVEFEHSINAAIRRLREVLGDAADESRYIETVRGRGYRLVATVSGATPIAALVVLPFASDGTADMEFFSDRLTESITNYLTTVQGLRVVPHPSALRYKRGERELESIGRDLAVQAIVTGRATLANEHVVVSAELIDVLRNSQVWGGRFRRQAVNMCEVRQEISLEVFGCLRLKLSPTSLE
jgi:DNA-binding winged helix-turn-helix (wHTH) protein